ncbi:hypothetical protein RvY_12596 [Ramazzottius varieornatus]|uniref:Uncharacterized protein n=1 Tax=Ramazzottius varieornatus TaxID=947166 RepID=A0A1D1VSN4_RAMVA|nr:hypothetical protein RvY_12596 [Ramazzottius varieornatus]
MTIEERNKLAHELNTLQQEIAVLDGETASRTAEIREREKNLVEVNDIIKDLKSKACAYALETKQIAQDVQERIAMDPKDKALMEGKNRLERVRGALLDLYAEQLVLKASFLAYAASLKGMGKKTRITKDLNEQTHQMMKDIPPLKQDIVTLRDKLTAFKRDTAEASVRLRDQIQQERERMITEAREQKYLVKLYEEEAKIMERLDSDLRLQLDSAVEVAGKLQLELRDNQKYFDHLTARLQYCIHHETLTPSGGMASILHRKKKTTSPTEAKPNEQVTAPKVDDTTVVTITAAQPKKEEGKLLVGKSAKKAADLQDILNDMDLKRGAMRAQIKYLEHKIQQLEIEVYISKMNVEIQMLQTSIKIETWKKTGKVPAAMTVSVIDTALRASQMPAVGSPSLHSPHDKPLETRHRVKRGSVGQDIIGAGKDSIVKGPRGVFGKTVDMAKGDKRI